MTHGGVAFALGRDDAARTESVYHNADYPLRRRARWAEARQEQCIHAMQANPEFMQQAIALATENVVSGRGGPFGAVVVRDGEVIATGANQVTATQRSDGARRGDGDPQRVQGAGALSARRLRGVHELRAVPDVPGGALLGALRRRSYYGNTAADAARDRVRRFVPVRRDEEAARSSARFRLCSCWPKRRWRALRRGRRGRSRWSTDGSTDESS